MRVYGTYYYPKQSRSSAAFLDYTPQSVSIWVDNRQIANHQQWQKAEKLQGLPSDLLFADGSRFVPDDCDFYWPNTSKAEKLTHSLEQNRLLLLGCLLGSILLVWLLLTRGIPAVAVYAVKVVPQSVLQHTSEQVLYAMEKTTLDPSQLPQKQQQHLRQLWQQHLAQLPLKQSHYQLLFYHSDVMGANAFALPSGQVVITDQLAELLKNNDTALLAVMLHEIGHVEHHHGVRLTAQSAIGAITFALVFGDLEGIAEIVLGTGSTLLEQRFSRDMEREADDFSLTHLQKLGYSKHAFAEAMSLIAKQHSDNEALPEWLEYFSSHPSFKERIEKTKN